ncbi:MAG: MarR family transcriptional regulator [bacterium]
MITNIDSGSDALSSPSPPGEEQRLILLLGLARHHLFTALDRALGAAAGITTVQAGALMFVGEAGGCLLGDLSRGLHLDNSAITGLVDRLEKKGLAAREPVPGDRRAWRVALTPSGRDAAEKARSVVWVYNESIQDCRPAGDVRGFRRVLEALIARFPQKTGP